MTSPRRPPIRPTAAAVLVCLLSLVAVIVSATSPAARAADAGRLQQRIGAGQSRVSGLSGSVQAAGKRVSGLGSQIAVLERQISAIQIDLDAKRAQLLTLQRELSTARAKLLRLQAAERRDQIVLSGQLVGSYEAARPDLVNVVLESTGFANLLERLAFAQRIGDHDAQIVGQVRASRRAVAAQATRLGALTLRQQSLTQQVLSERNRIGRARVTLVIQQLAAIKVRDARAGQLATARGQVASLQGQLSQLRAAQRAQAAKAAKAAAQSQSSASNSGSSSAAPGSGASNGSNSSSGAPAPAPPSSTGGFTFPLPKAAASPPGTWSLDDGVDISAPGGTPEFAICSGTIVLHGIGGFGPSAPVLHCDSPLGGYDYVYYGHAGPGNWTPVGSHVSAGQVISEVGSGIVGISSGPHLEIGFADSSGSPVGPASASQMMSLLQASYGG